MTHRQKLEALVRKEAEEYSGKHFIRYMNNGQPSIAGAKSEQIEEAFNYCGNLLLEPLAIALEAMKAADKRLEELGCPINGFEREPLLTALSRIEKLLEGEK